MSGFTFHFNKTIKPPEQENEDESFTINWTGGELISLRMDVDGQNFTSYPFNEEEFYFLIKEYLRVRKFIFGIDE